jgi:hypothetical protein
MDAISPLKKQDLRKKTDSLGEVDLPSDELKLAAELPLFQFFRFAPPAVIGGGRECPALTPLMIMRRALARIRQPSDDYERFQRIRCLMVRSLRAVASTAGIGQ